MLPHHNKDIYAEVHNDLKTGADLNQRTDLKPLDVGQIVRFIHGKEEKQFGKKESDRKNILKILFDKEE